MTDSELLAAIRGDLACSLWTGEGHRKVWARLRVIDGIRVGRTRVLRVMDENHLSPRIAAHPVPPTTMTAPSPPCAEWGAYGAVVPTVKDGNVSLFIVAASSSAMVTIPSACESAIQVRHSMLFESVGHSGIRLGKGRRAK